MRNHWKISLIFLLGFVFLLKSSSIKCQNITLGYADSLFIAEDYTKAALEYEKYIFSYYPDSSVSYAITQKAYCYKNSGNYFAAYQNYARIDLNNVSDSLKCFYNYQIALMLYLSDKYVTSEKFLQENFNLNIENQDYKNSMLLHALVLNEQFKYKEAKAKLLFYGQNYCDKSLRDSFLIIISQLYSKDEIPKIKSLKKARRISMFLPGGGLFYIGKPGRALVNIFLLSGSLFYTGLNVYAGTYITSATAGVHLIRLFYTGGINQLNDLVPLVNNQRTKDFNKHIRDSIYTWLED